MTRLWRSRKVMWVSTILAFALVAAACGDDDDVTAPASTQATTTTQAATTTTAAPAATTTTAAPAATTTTEAPGKPYGGQVVIANDQEPPTLNSMVPGGDNFIVGIVGNAYWTGVQDIDGFTLELIPEVVVELPSVANGGVSVNADGTMTVRYQIRDDAVWADGTPISGDDFQFTLETIMNPDNQVDQTIYEDIVASTAGPKTFEYTLSAPTVQFELIFGVLVPKHDVEGSNFLTDWNETMWVSGGPFEFVEWQSGEFIKLSRNENYWKTDAETGQQLPFLDEVIFRFIPETESLINAFRAREVDVINPPPATATIEALQDLEPDGASVEVVTGPIWEHLNFQFGEGRLVRNPGSANENLAYRQSVGHLVNKNTIVDEILAGQVEPLDSYVEAFSPTLSQGSWTQYDYNVEKAIALREQAQTELGVDSIPVVFSTTSNNDARVTLSELFVDMFTAAGYDYTNDLEDSQIFFGETLDNGQWDLGEWAWVGTPGFAGLISIHDIWDPEAPPPDGSNFYRWGTPGSSVIDDVTARFAEVRDEMNASVDEDVLIPLINEAETLLADNAVIHPLYARLDPGAVWADEIAGYKHNPSQAGDTWNIEEWYRVDLA